jgi:hypothetical protein
VIRDIAFVRPDGVLGQALGISQAAIQKCEDLVTKACDENWSLRRLVETANETLDLNDAEWTTFMYTLGWWDHSRRG